MNQLQYNEKAYEALAAYLHSGRLPHAILLEGPAGSGKSTFAREIAQGAMCTAEDAHKPCGTCRDCVKAGKSIHPDILLYGGDGGSKSFHVEAVRQLRQEAFIRPGEGDHKVLILEDVQDMTPQASNALLKVLEEPPERVIFILTCENKSALLETILSRVALIQLHTLSLAQCAEVLTQLRPGLDTQQYHKAAQSNGSVGRALLLLDALTAEEPAENSTAKQLMQNLLTGSEMDGLAMLAPLEKDKEAFLNLLEELAALTKQLLSGDADADMQRLCRRANPLQLMQILAIIEEIASAVPANVNRLLLTTNLCAKIKLVLAR